MEQSLLKHKERLNVLGERLKERLPKHSFEFNDDSCYYVSKDDNNYLYDKFTLVSEWKQFLGMKDLIIINELDGIFAFTID